MSVPRENRLSAGAMRPKRPVVAGPPAGRRYNLGMSNKATVHNVSLGSDEIGLLLQSLDHCLATCNKKTAGKSGPCEDCDRARALRQRLAKQIGA
jgi:hypothetical protein